MEFKKKYASPAIYILILVLSFKKDNIYKWIFHMDDWPAQINMKETRIFISEKENTYCKNNLWINSHKTALDQGGKKMFR